ncbi:MAG: hypothetical protein Q8900_09015 [Bacillota bacterium]|nr:hypothetical protein [Bacillota bacterium]
MQELIIKLISENNKVTKKQIDKVAFICEKGKKSTVEVRMIITLGGK